MPENVPDNSQPESQERKKSEYLSLAKDLSERHEGFPFPGINKGAYETIKAEEEAYLEHITPIDDVLARLESAGMKVVFGDHPEDGSVFILPKNSFDIRRDSLFPRHLMSTGDIDPGLKKLIDMHVGLNSQ